MWYFKQSYYALENAIQGCHFLEKGQGNGKSQGNFVKSQGILKISGVREFGKKVREVCQKSRFK